MLAEVAAKRRIVDLHADDHECPVADPELDGDAVTGIYTGDCPTLRLLFLPYADHPDYQPEWAPE